MTAHKETRKTRDEQKHMKEHSERERERKKSELSCVHFTAFALIGARDHRVQFFPLSLFCFYCSSLCILFEMSVLNQPSEGKRGGRRNRELHHFASDCVCVWERERQKNANKWQEKRKMRVNTMTNVISIHWSIHVTWRETLQSRKKVRWPVKQSLFFISLSLFVLPYFPAI